MSGSLSSCYFSWVLLVGRGKLRLALLDGGKGQGIEIGAKLWER